MSAILAIAGGVGCNTERPGEPAPPPASSPAIAPPLPATTAKASAAPAASAAAPIDATQKVEKILPLLRKMAADPKVTKAIEAQNAKRMTLDEIKKRDAEWTASTGLTDMIRPYLENACAQALKKFEAQLPSMVEGFAMDNQGANVCTITKTSDYWQGDEAKWQKSFAEGKGAEFIDKPKFDDSSQTYSVQVSLPVMAKDRAIGAITVGLALDKL